jgi:hypothetical protein
MQREAVAVHPLFLQPSCRAARPPLPPGRCTSCTSASSSPPRRRCTCCTGGWVGGGRGECAARRASLGWPACAAVSFAFPPSPLQGGQARHPGGPQRGRRPCVGPLAAHLLRPLCGAGGHAERAVWQDHIDAAAHLLHRGQPAGGRAPPHGSAPRSLVRGRRRGLPQAPGSTCAQLGSPSQASLCPRLLPAGQLVHLGLPRPLCAVCRVLDEVGGAGAPGSRVPPIPASGRGRLLGGSACSPFLCWPLPFLQPHARPPPPGSAVATLRP